MINFKVIGAALLLGACNVQAAVVDTFSCDTCTEQQAINLARSKAPPLHCYWNNEPGTIPGVDDQVCDGSAKTFIIANPVARQSYKFRVQSIPNGHLEKIVRVNNLTLSNDEITMLNKFYELDSEFYSVSNFSIPGQDLNQNSGFTTRESLETLIGPMRLTDGDQCAGHPSKYLKSTRAQEQLYNQLAAKVYADMNGQNWSDYTTETRLAGGGINLELRRGLGLNISLSHNKRQVHANTVWDENNRLVFDVTYKGQYTIGTQNKLLLDFKVARGVSRIDGLSLEYWSLKKVDLTKEPNVSECMKEYIDSIAEKSVTVPGRPPGDYDPPGGDPSRLCTKRVTAYSCTPWSCLRQEFLVPNQC
ncbi:hypothetical protein L3V43_22465 [Pseudoalteromonas sp. L23]|uniref:hypothetical protein n=1 Tax=Pseudoalteromonas TaxID=53246 RepID=UPI001EEFBD93|nr:MULTISPECIES: hypothetical protein [unclassified Pseudoalteromonas]MCF7516366.1 hypothetical protein [Pseudoalteromonas sp. L7]MCF7528413.1 hypothetical protein [Pseudoalteromonas sp. L23]MCG7552571.1 hypothetical protein [Pseudoalteromonas sp. Of11M-6]MCX2767911.1 hypothetical protein [Pseudoalteromonas sp. B530]